MATNGDDEYDEASYLKDVGKSALEGAMHGSKIGSFIPGVGSIAGAGIGAGAGAAKKFWDDMKKTGSASSDNFCG